MKLWFSKLPLDEYYSMTLRTWFTVSKRIEVSFSLPASFSQTGTWTPSLLLPYVSLPIIPVAHPYLYGGGGGGRGDPPLSPSSSFVRYPSAKVYIRQHNHQKVSGMGSYDHAPTSPSTHPARPRWTPDRRRTHPRAFDVSVEKARSLFPDPRILNGGHRIHGVFRADAG
jgi:sarcosine oxidase